MGRISLQRSRDRILIPRSRIRIWTPGRLAPHDRVVKRRLYAHHGVRWHWVVDPTDRVLEAFELRDGLWVNVGVYDEKDTARIPLFEAVELPMSRLFLPRSKGSEET